MRIQPRLGPFTVGAVVVVSCCLWTTIQACQPPLQQQQQQQHGGSLSEQKPIHFDLAKSVATCGLWAGLVLSSFSTPVGAATPADNNNNNNENWQSQLQSSLQAPTADRPKIQLPSGSSNTNPNYNNNGKQLKLPPPNVVQALISLANPQQFRPLGSDIMVIQVYDQAPPTSQAAPAQESVLLGGAKIPVAQLKFPTMVALGPQNAVKSTTITTTTTTTPKDSDSANVAGLTSSSSWNQVTSNQDVWMSVSICPEESLIFPCAPQDQRMAAAGLSKLLQQVPGMEMELGEIGDSGIRVPASLALEQ